MSDSQVRGQPLGRCLSTRAIVAALTASMIGALALFVLIKTGAPATMLAILRQQFYTPIPNPTDPFFDRSIRSIRVLLQLGLAPFMVFIVAQFASGYAMFKLLSVRGARPVLWRLLAAIAFSLLVTAVFLAVAWYVLAPPIT